VGLARREWSSSAFTILSALLLVSAITSGAITTAVMSLGCRQTFPYKIREELPVTQEESPT
jgi:hypothetical protein